METKVMRQVSSFIKLKRLASQAGQSGQKLLVMGDCATQHLATALRGTAVQRDIMLEVIDTDYNLIDILTIDESSELFTSAPDYVLIHMCAEKMQERFREIPDKTVFAEQMLEKIQEYWVRIGNRLNTNILMFSFLEADDGVFGTYASRTADSFLFQIRKLNFLVSEAAEKQKNVFIIDINQVAMQLGLEQFRDAKLYYTAKMPISLKGLPFVAANVMDCIFAICGKIKKCVVLDLDNTLWGGIIGDDGLEGIQIGELGLGHAFEDLQHWLNDLKQRGIILCVCSKNNEDAAKLPFEKHPDMVLKLEDISVFVANWEDKASNIRFIQQTLNIGMDSMVFLDDNPFERNLVQTMIPEITVPELPEDPSAYLDYLKSLNLFETASYSQADKDRTDQYRAEMQRINTQKSFASYDDYLQSLNMVATIAPFDAYQTPRIAQLTQRSNQFNLRTIRCTEEDITRIANDNQYLTAYFMLKDKFGDHGLISLVILKKQKDRTLFIHNWLMSCRVLKRGMEAFIINKIMEIAQENGYERVIGEYIKTPKNAMVAHIYEQYGFEKISENRYEASVKAYKPIKTYITRMENE